jgi:hypothetical protein
MNNTQTASDRNQRRTTNILLGAVLCLMGYNALSQTGVGTASTAFAQPSGEEGLVSAAEQRKVMIAELRSLSSRIERVESVLAKGISVKVTDMPPVKLADPSQLQEPRDPKRASK